METIELITGDSIPRNICKYFPINDDLRKSIRSNYLWFSDPLEFNDPYDCNLLFNTDNSEEEIKNFITKEKLKRLRIGDPNALRVPTNDLVNYYKKDPIALRSALHSIIIKKLKDFGICCFSENPLDLLMWSHYADKHKGICILFDIEEDINFFTFPIKVHYPERYPNFNYIRDRNNESASLIQFLFGNKPKNYSYEDEVRVIKASNSTCNHRGKMSISKSAFKKVFFGYKMSEAPKKELYKLFTTSGYKLSFHNMYLKENDFGLRPEQYILT